MGLSDEERIAKLYGGIASIHRELRDATVRRYEVQWGDELDRLKELAGDLWHAFLGANSIDTYWIFGGDADAAIASPKGPWSVGVSCHLPVRPEQDDDLRDMEFNPFRGFIDLPGILKGAGGAYKQVHGVYAATEFCAYALRRYDDDLSKGFAQLSKVISDMQGTCYAIFSSDQTFAKAYVLSRTLAIIFSGSRGGIFLDATGKKLVSGIHMHHSVAGLDKSLELIAAVDKALGKAPTPIDRAHAALRLAGSRFHYDHQFESLVKAFGAKSRARLAPEFAACKALHEEDERRQRKQYSDDARRDEWQAVHGWDDNPYDDSPPKPKKKRGVA